MKTLMLTKIGETHNVKATFTYNLIGHKFLIKHEDRTDFQTTQYIIFTTEKQTFAAPVYHRYDVKNNTGEVLNKH